LITLNIAEILTVKNYDKTIKFAKNPIQSVNVINQPISLALPMHLKSFVGEDYGLY
jgi:hypothetical protein